MFDAASKVLGQQVTSQPTSAVTGLEQALARTAGMAGTDPGGTTWAASNDHATAVTVGGMTDLTNACYKLAAMLELTGFNHGRAESASDPTRTAPTPGDTTRYAAPATLSCDPQPPSAHGGAGHPPRGWGLVEHLVGYVWPNGDPWQAPHRRPRLVRRGHHPRHRVLWHPRSPCTPSAASNPPRSTPPPRSAKP